MLYLFQEKIVDIAFSTNLGHASTSNWIKGYIEQKMYDFT